MPQPLMTVLAYTLIPVAATVAGGIMAAFHPPSPRVRSYAQHFAAGVVFAALAVELLPDVVHERAPVAAMIGFALGTALMLLLRQLTEKGDKQEARSTLSLIAPVGIDITIDGLLIGIGFAAGAKEGKLLTVALTLEVLFLGLAVAASLGKAGASQGRIIGTTCGLAFLLAAGAAIGTSLLGGLKGPALEAVLSFGCAALLYLVTEELLVEAHEVPETPFTTATFFIGFLLLLMLDMTG